MSEPVNEGNEGGKAEPCTPCERLRWIVLGSVAFAVLLVLFVSHGLRYSFLCDDAFITFRYARNLIRGDGLVFNPGERVEGYTNFLWLLEIAAVWKFLGIRPEVGSLILSWLATIGTIWITLLLSLRTRTDDWRWGAAWIALLLLATNRNFAVWTTSGLETRQFTMLLLLGVLLVSQRAAGWGALVGASLAFASATLTRPEGLMFFALAGLWYFVDCGARQQLKVGRLAALALPYAAIVGSHFLFRHAYYDDWLPNTFYAKVARPWYSAGLLYYKTAVLENAIYLTAPLALIGAIWQLWTKRDSTFILFGILITAHAAYLARVGGDHFEFRPLDFYWPLLAVMAAEGILTIATAIAGRAGNVMATVVGGFLVILCLAYGCALQLGKYYTVQHLKTREQTLKLHVPITPDNFAAAFYLPGMNRIATSYNSALTTLVARLNACPWIEHKTFAEIEMADYGPYEAMVGQKMIPTDAVTADTSVGIMPFYLADLKVIDRHGLTDRATARQEAVLPDDKRQMAHDKWASVEYLESRKVNFYPWPVARNIREALAHAPFAARFQSDGTEMFMPFEALDAGWPAKAFPKSSVYHTSVTAELGGWQVIGESFEGQPSTIETTGTRAVRGYPGTMILSSYHATLGDSTTGTATSSAFAPKAGEMLDFYLTGTIANRLGVALDVDGKEVKVWRPFHFGRVTHVAENLTPWVGDSCRIRIFDDEIRPLGHIMAGHFRIVVMPDGPAN
ncbi:MAG: hypothetical protein K1X53_12445 [Candidatus Sumerlaeaceae bacterium]|nr:hypothetical protein [Candidatus Sumerlaeaceae bacterium]